MLFAMDANSTYAPIFSPARRYLTNRYGPLLAGSAVICIAGDSLGYWLGADPIPTCAMGSIVALAVIYFVWFYIRMPGRLAGRMKRSLDPAVRLRVDSQGILASVVSGPVLIDWSRVKFLLEQESYFLLVLSPFSYLIVPKPGLPSGSAIVLRDRLTQQSN
jgi:hypothetical protein